MISPAFAYMFVESQKSFSCVYRNEEDSPLIKPFICSTEVVLETPWINKDALDAFDTPWINDYMEETFGNTFIVSPNDSLLRVFMNLEDQGVVDLRMMECSSPECFAKVVYDDINPIVLQKSNGLIKVTRVGLCPNVTGYTYSLSASS